MKRIIVIMMLVLPILSNAETDKQAVLGDLLSQREDVTYNQAAICKAFSDIVFHVRILKDNGLTLSETTDMLKKFPDDIKKMIKLVYTKNPSLKELSEYSDKFYWDCVDKTKKNVPLL